MNQLALHNLQYYFKRLKTYYGSTLDSLWRSKFEVEDILNWTNDFFEMSNIRNAFILFYIIKSKMTLNGSYHWGLVLQNYNIDAIKEWLECNNLTLALMIKVFSIDTTIPVTDTVLVYSDVDHSYTYIIKTNNNTYSRLVKE